MSELDGVADVGRRLSPAPGSVLAASRGLPATATMMLKGLRVDRRTILKLGPPVAVVAAFGGLSLLETACSNPLEGGTSASGVVAKPVLPAPRDLYGAVTSKRPKVDEPLTLDSAARIGLPDSPELGCKPENDGYHALVPGRLVHECPANSLDPVPYNRTLGVQVKVTVTGGAGGGGLVIGSPDSSQAYLRFAIFRQGHTDLFDPVTRWRRAETTVSARDRHLLTAIIFDRNVYLYIDGSAFGPIPLEPEVLRDRMAKVGFFAVDENGSRANVVFTGLKIYAN